jgi:hypothetical protein
LFLVVVRLSGTAVAAFCEKVLSPLSQKLAHAAGQKIRAFHAGLDILRTPWDFVITMSISLFMWGVIAFAYFEGSGAFESTSQGGSQAMAKCLALMAGGGVASVIQLPVIGWFTQIAALELMLEPLFGMTPETARACAATLLAITFLGITPVGLLWAQFEHINLRKVTVESEHAGEENAAS